MKFVYAIIISALFLFSCKTESKQDESSNPPKTEQKENDISLTPPPGTQFADPDLAEKIANLKPKAQIPSSDEEPKVLKGVNLSYPLLPGLVRKGENVYNSKCASCHDLSSEQKKASGFLGITLKREPVWIMNMTRGADFQLSPQVQEQKALAKCPVRSKDGRLTLIEARDLLEFLRFNDGEGE